MTIYFDNAATTRIKPEVLKEMIPYLNEEYGNPSSIYHIGRAAKRAIESAREKVARLINCEKNEIYFTSGGTESDNTAIKGVVYAENKKKHIITTKIEHHAVLESCACLERHGYEVTYINVDNNGMVDLNELNNAIKDNTVLISVMFANNEIGTIEPIEKIAKIAKKRGIIFHTDAVQAVGNVPIDVKKMGIDMLSLSGHKIYGPKGVGALYVKKGIKFERFMDGGHQERGRRASTENLASIVGLGKACEIASIGCTLDEKNNDDGVLTERSLRENHIEKVKRLRDYYISQVKANISDIRINGSMKDDERLPGNANISFKGVDSTALLLELDKNGICASSGSACTSGDSEPSHVLTAIGLSSEYASSALRTTFGDFNSKWEIDYAVKCLKEAVEKLRNIENSGNF